MLDDEQGALSISVAAGSGLSARFLLLWGNGFQWFGHRFTLEVGIV